MVELLGLFAWILVLGGVGVCEARMRWILCLLVWAVERMATVVVVRCMVCRSMGRRRVVMVYLVSVAMAVCMPFRKMEVCREGIFVCALLVVARAMEWRAIMTRMVRVLVM